MRVILAGTAAVVGGALLVAGCSSSSSSSSSSASASGGASSSSSAAAAAPVTVRLGLLANITHAPALIALKDGYFKSALGSAGSVTPTVFSSGTQETTAILAGQLDAAYVGPNPAINAWQKSGGQAIKIISGVATGGASVVVKSSIGSASQLKGQSVATPSLGNTQDVAVRYWLKQNGLATSATGGGDVAIKPTTPNSAAVLEFKSGQIAGASEPSPYDIEMVQDGGKVLLSEPGVTTLLMVTQSFLSAHPAVVADLLKANMEAVSLTKSSPTAAEAAAGAELAALSGKALKASLVAASFKEITFTVDPDATSLTTDSTQAVSLGLLKPVSLSGIFDLTPLNTLLTAAGQPNVSS
jgi:NitT/TauT family transport system substrate-binding protein